jgi:hypothetical protein
MAKTSCSIEGCDRPRRARGWCKMHYGRWHYSGDPLGLINRWTVVERLYARVEKTETCWLWTGFQKANGHGQIQLGRRGAGLRGAHVVAWEAVNGPVPPGHVLHHICETPACVRPDHLTPMTRAEHARLHAYARTTCRRGHPFDGWKPNGKHRTCSICTAIRKGRKKEERS